MVSNESRIISLASEQICNSLLCGKWGLDEVGREVVVGSEIMDEI